MHAGLSVNAPYVHSHADANAVHRIRFLETGKGQLVHCHRYAQQPRLYQQLRG